MKKETLKTMEQMKMHGCNRKTYFELIDLPRRTGYNWIGRKGRYEDLKPIPLSNPTMISEVRQAKVKIDYCSHHGISGAYSISVRTGISRSKTAEILQKSRPYLPLQLQPDENSGYYEFTKTGICSAMDFLEYYIGGEKQVLLDMHDEYSKYVESLEGYTFPTVKAVIMTLEKAFSDMKYVPYVMKHDADPTIFCSIQMQCYLREKGILTLISPGYYAKFNARLENTNRQIKECLRKMPYYGEPSWQRLFNVRKFMNYERPRMNFCGKTSMEIYQTADFPEISREEFIRLVEEKRKKGAWAFPRLSKGGDALKRYAICETMKDLGWLKYFAYSKKKNKIRKRGYEIVRHFHA